MGRTLKRPQRRRRVGRVSLYQHHQSWWIYYRELGRPVRRRISASIDEANRVAAQVNAQLAAQTPTQVAFTPVDVPVLRLKFLEFHENVLRSSLATIDRYRTATLHLERFCNEGRQSILAHLVSVLDFASYLRRVPVAPNGHANTCKRKLRDKGVQFILETCRSMYAFAARNHHLPPFADNPFASLPIQRLRIQDSKPIFVFDEDTELAFLKATDPWDFSVFFTLAKTGLRIGELTHLLIDDLELETGWLWVRNKPDLGWRIKTGHERRVPLIAELVSVLKHVIGTRRVGPVFLRRRFTSQSPVLCLNRSDMEKTCARRCESLAAAYSRRAFQRVARTIWRDAGAIDCDQVRNSFIRIMRQLGHEDATCPKSWRHSFATLLQDANVDPLIRHLTLGHRPTTDSGLGMTAHYTHTRPQTLQTQIEAALRLRPRVLTLAQLRMEDYKQ